MLDDAIVAAAHGRIRRLAITMPPRHGKSEFASKWTPSWVLGRWPRRRVILSSYEADFAAQWGRKTRDILEQHGEEIFGVRVRRDSKAADRWEIDEHGGGMQTCGVGGPLTGKGADWLIIDDPVKNAEQANSETYRQKTWDWYTSTAYTRLEPGGVIVLIMTRWHEDDLAGRILANAADTGEEWVCVNFPAIAGTDGDALGRPAGAALWPERYGVADLDRIRQTLGSYQYSALYDQRPTPPEGGLFKRSWFGYWKPELDGDAFRLTSRHGTRMVLARHCRRFGTMDLAFSLKKEADYTVLCGWAVTPDCDLILLDILRERMEGPALVPAARAMTARWGLDYLGIEQVAGQALVVAQARQEGLTVRELVPDKDKVTRSIPAQVRMEAGQVYMPEGHPLLPEIEKELLTFPRGAHDDIVDNFAYGAAEVTRFGPASLPPEIKEQRDRDAREARDELARLWAENPFDPRFDTQWTSATPRG